jgi:hypothetical protein
MAFQGRTQAGSLVEERIHFLSNNLCIISSNNVCIVIFPFSSITNEGEEFNVLQYKSTDTSIEDIIDSSARVDE